MVTETIFNKLTTGKALLAMACFPLVIVLHLFSFFFSLTGDIYWASLFANLTTLFIMSVLYIKLFTGKSFLASLDMAKGTIFFILILAVIQQMSLFVISDDVKEAAMVASQNAITTKELSAKLLDIVLISSFFVFGVHFLGLLMFFGLSSATRGSVD